MHWHSFLLVIATYVQSVQLIFLDLDPKLLSLKSQPYPEGFLFGASSSAYQVEGAWNVDGKGPSVWDTLVHKTPSPVVDGSTGDVACNSYYLYKEDVKNLVKLGVKMYRFSISWSRVLPNGTTNNVNPLGVQYYSNLIDELLDHGIIPMVTLYHFDLPQALEDYGGWVNSSIVDYFGNYTEFAFQQFGDRVKWWITLNEPVSLCVYGYGLGTTGPPGVTGYGRLEYNCINNAILSHARAYHVYRDKYKHQGGMLSVSLSSDGCYPKQQTHDDIDACERYYQFYIGIFAHPIFTLKGNYPESVIQIVDTNSRNEGLNSSRLIPFTQHQIDYIKGTADFFGFNVYGSVLASSGSTTIVPGFLNDMNVETSISRFWPRTISSTEQVTPKVMRDTLVLIMNRYGNPEIFITENGMPEARLLDAERLLFLKTYLGSMQNAMIQDGVRVIGYNVWSLMDDFEWTNGYTTPFGLYYVNFSDPKRPREPRASASFYKMYIRANTQN